MLFNLSGSDRSWYAVYDMQMREVLLKFQCRKIKRGVGLTEGNQDFRKGVLR